jgi:hypothetical protein
VKKWLTCLTILLIVLVFVLGIIVYLLEVYIPRAAEKSIAGLIQTRLQLEKPPEVRLKFSVLELLGGKLSEIDISFSDLVFNNVTSEKVKIKISNIHLDVGKLIREKKPELTEPFSAWVSFYLPEQEVKNQLHNNMVIPYDWEVELKPDKLFIQADVEPVKGQIIPATLVGRLEANGTLVRFVPVDVQGVDPLMASIIKTVVFPDLRKNIFLQNLPSGVKILKIKILRRKLLVIAEAEDIVLPEEMMNQ